MAAGSAFLFPFAELPFLSSLCCWVDSHRFLGFGRRAAVTARLRREPARPRWCGAAGRDEESRRTWVAAAGDSPEAMNGGRGKLMKRTSERDLLCFWASSWRVAAFLFLLPICFRDLLLPPFRDLLLADLFPYPSYIVSGVGPIIAGGPGRPPRAPPPQGRRCGHAPTRMNMRRSVHEDL